MADGIWTIDALDAHFSDRIDEILTHLDEHEEMLTSRSSGQRAVAERTFRIAQTRLKELHKMATELSLPASIELVSKGYKDRYHRSL